MLVASSQDYEVGNMRASTGEIRGFEADVKSIRANT
jgi:hypothetical protein